MKPLRTEVKLERFSFQMDRKDCILCLGSCFAEEMGARLKRQKYRVLINPWGIIFNPMSIAKAITAFVNGGYDIDADLAEHDGETVSLAHHGNFRSLDRNAIRTRIAGVTSDAQEFLHHTKCIMLTLGTANVFEWKASGTVVANCHRISQDHFARRRLSVKEIVDDLSKAFKQLFVDHKDIQIILTVSPVRHRRDGLVSNQRSKATLHLAVDELCSTFEQCDYFPAYEILQDDLRDYRFYQEDMIHPSTLARDYVYEQFDHCCLQSDPSLNQAIEKLQRGLSHRPRGSNSARHQDFVQSLRQQLTNIQSEHPYIDLSDENQILMQLEDE